MIARYNISSLRRYTVYYVFPCLGVRRLPLFPRLVYGVNVALAVERRQLSSGHAKTGRFLLISLRGNAGFSGKLAPPGQQMQTSPPDEKTMAFRASGVDAQPAFYGRGCEGCRGTLVTP